MPKKIFVNIAVSDLAQSMEFFKKLGFTFNQQFTDETAAAMVISEDIYAMLLTIPKMKSFTKKEVVNSHDATEAIIALSVDSRQEADELLQKALAAGATRTRPEKDYGFMYECSFDDLDGHQWEIFWMDPDHVQK